MNELTQRVEQAREKERTRLRGIAEEVDWDFYKAPGLRLHEWEESIDRLVALERAEAGLHWAEHLKDHNDGMCAACYLEGELEDAILAIEEPDHA